MIRHILFWKFIPEMTEEEKAEKLKEITASSDHMVGKIEGLVSARVGKNLAGGEWDFIYDSLFSDAQALEAYQTHPLHMAHKKRFAPYLSARLVGDLVE